MNLATTAVPPSLKVRAPWRLAAAALIVGLAGCSSFQRLQDEVDELDSRAIVAGKVVEGTQGSGPVYAVVYHHEADGRLAIESAAEVTGGDRQFVLTVPNRDDLRLAVFQDSDGDQAYTEGEPVWLHHGGQPIVFGPRRRTEVIPVRLAASSPALTPQFLAAIKEARARRDVPLGAAQVTLRVGQIASFDDARFTPQMGQKGLWEPFTSLSDPGIGVYFVEPYDPKRIPVLFVHGAGGTPRDWAAVAGAIDTRRFQVWMYAYPSGLRLDACAGALSTLVGQLRAKYGFAEMHVFAHSMGGLVARRYLELESTGLRAPLHGKFITVATPWQGHEAADLGVAHAPAVVPSWIDMQVGSDYTSALFKTPLPASMPSFLAFAYSGKRSMFLPSSNDGSVSLESQLRWDAQRAAVEVRGFNAGHVSVLSSPELKAWIDGILTH